MALPLWPLCSTVKYRVVRAEPVFDEPALFRAGERGTLSTETEQHLLTVAEVADVLRVSTMTVYRLIRSGELLATRVGRSYRIWENDVQSYLRRGRA